MQQKSTWVKGGPRTNPQEKYSINDKITASQVRLIGENGEQVGVVSLRDALARAEDVGLDLVEVAPEAKPPVCRILDYGKLKYREQKKAAEARKRGATHAVKEIRVRYSTDQHDIDTKVRQARRFLAEGDRVRFQMQFRGREVVYGELGQEIFRKVAEMLADDAIIDEKTPLLGKRMTITFAPKPKGENKAPAPKV